MDDQTLCNEIVRITEVVRNNALNYNADIVLGQLITESIENHIAADLHDGMNNFQNQLNIEIQRRNAGEV